MIPPKKLQSSFDKSKRKASKLRAVTAKLKREEIQDDFGANLDFTEETVRSMIERAKELIVKESFESALKILQKCERNFSLH